MLELNPGIFPDGGYFFIERDGTELRAESWKKLESRIRGYRAVNRLDPGEPWVEITTQLCSRQPSFCRERPIASRAGHSMTFNSRVMQWFVGVIGLKRVGRLPRGDNENAAARAAICSRCPAQKSLVESCQSCLRSIKHSRKAILDGASSEHRNLQPCGVLGEDTQVSVYFDQPPADPTNLPANCWRRK